MIAHACSTECARCHWCGAPRSIARPKQTTPGQRIPRPQFCTTSCRNRWENWRLIELRASERVAALEGVN